MPRVSVIIPSLNEGKYIENCLKSLAAQTFDDFEIIIADSGSTDETHDIAKKYGARIVQGAKKGPGEGRNRGARAARADTFMFIDADCKASPTLLQDIVDVLDRGKDVVGGTVAFMPDDGTFMDRLLYRMANLYEKVSIDLNFPHNSGYCFFFRKTAYEKLGGIREDLVLNETQDVALRTKAIGRFVYLKTPVYTSLRRFKKEGYFNTVIKTYVGSTVYYYLTKKTPASQFKWGPVR